VFYYLTWLFNIEHLINVSTTPGPAWCDIASMPTLLLADDSEVIRNAVKRLLETEPAIKAHLRPTGSEIKIIGISLSGNDDDEARDLATSLGASTLVEKSRFYDELIPAILSR
jgi:hypothetical protein